MSKFERGKDYQDVRRWNHKKMKKSVIKNFSWIMAEEYEQITGQTYEPDN